MAANLGAWEAAVAARDAELVALQSALGELAYESDAAERLRAELRGAQGRAEDLRRRDSQLHPFAAILTATTQWSLFQPWLRRQTSNSRRE